MPKPKDFKCTKCGENTNISRNPIFWCQSDCPNCGTNTGQWLEPFYIVGVPTEIVVKVKSLLKPYTQVTQKAQKQKPKVTKKKQEKHIKRVPRRKAK